MRFSLCTTGISEKTVAKNKLSACILYDLYMYSSDCYKHSECSIDLSIQMRIKIKWDFSVLNTLKGNTNETKYVYVSHYASCWTITY